QNFNGPRTAISLANRRRKTCNLFSGPVLRFLNFQGRISGKLRITQFGSTIDQKETTKKKTLTEYGIGSKRMATVLKERTCLICHFVLRRELWPAPLPSFKGMQAPASGW